MKGRNWFKTYWSDILKVVILMIWIISSIVFGIFTWEVNYTAEWKRWVALVIGQIAYLYSLVFVLAGICTLVSSLVKDKDWSFGGIEGAVLLIGSAIIIQLTFWGIVLYSKKCLYAIGVVVVVCLILLLINGVSKLLRNR